MMELDGCGQVSLIGELTQGMEMTRQLKAVMGPEITGETKGVLIEGILSSYQKALLILKCGGSMEQCQQHVVPSTIMPGSPISVIGSPKSEELNNSANAPQDSRDFSRKSRKALPSRTEKVKASFENGMEVLPDDGFSWRKYGQKDILGAQYPRSYYRCTYRHIQGCSAVKQVQRHDEDPSIFNLTYKGRHTCKLVPRSKSAPTSPGKQQRNKNSLPTTEYQQQSNVMLNFQAGLTVDIQDLENQEINYPFPAVEYRYENQNLTPSVGDNHFHGNFSPFLLSPETSESNLFSTSTSKMNTFEFHHRQSESENADIISATTSASNSPIVGIDFRMDQLEYNPCFPFDNPSFFHSFSQGKEFP